MALPEKMKNILSFVGRFVFSGGLLIFLFSKIDMAQMMEAVKHADLFYIGMAAVIFFLIHLVMLVRWWVFIKALDLEASVRDVIRFFFIGLFGNLFLPSAIGGDVIKILGLCRNSSQKPRVVASVLLDRLSGFASIVLVAILAFVFGYGMIEQKMLILPILAMAGGALTVTVVLFNEKIYSMCCVIFNPFPKIKKSLMNLHYDVSLMKGKRNEGLKAIALGCCSQTALAVSFYLTAKGLHQDINFIYFLIFVPMICVVSILPSIGGLGVREVGAAYLFAQIGVAESIAVTISLFNFLFMVLIGLFGGVLYVFTVSSRRVQHHASDAGLVGGEAGGPTPSADPVA